MDMTGFYFDAPEDCDISLGSNICSSCPYVLIVNDKPLIEMWSHKDVHYGKNQMFIYMRFYDMDNNFIGGMFGNHWISVSEEEWIAESVGNKKIKVTNKGKDIFIQFINEDGVVKINGQFYFDGIKIFANDNELILPKENKFQRNHILGHEVAFNISGSKDSAVLSIGGRLQK